MLNYLMRPQIQFGVTMVVSGVTEEELDSEGYYPLGSNSAKYTIKLI
jgi:hypothetical protein